MRPSEIERAARELMDAIYDRGHRHIHFFFDDETSTLRANQAAQKLAKALGLE